MKCKIILTTKANGPPVPRAVKKWKEGKQSKEYQDVLNRRLLAIALTLDGSDYVFQLGNTSTPTSSYNEEWFNANKEAAATRWEGLGFGSAELQGRNPIPLRYVVYVDLAHVKGQTSSHWCGVEIWRRGPTHVSISLSDHG
ncbi:hypothetical protein AVEN_63493-1 [Araneus ventricosus]|uniref:Uncharacterized protein n=1 Tax=Araneus ventricosus TaxID=182803 RepID=A0A4Y2CUV5_ARAVE|nr:hypothetical protein AVEN_63493-1 [Araneus ventricosus]